MGGLKCRSCVSYTQHAHPYYASVRSLLAPHAYLSAPCSFHWCYREFCAWCVFFSPVRVFLLRNNIWKIKYEAETPLNSVIYWSMLHFVSLDMPFPGQASCRQTEFQAHQNVTTSGLFDYPSLTVPECPRNCPRNSLLPESTASGSPGLSGSDNRIGPVGRKQINKMWLHATVKGIWAM